MNLKIRLLYVFIIGILLIQFIRPIPNISTGNSNTEISKVYNVPDSVLLLLKAACFDCHSNNTNYPWYGNIQPIGWLLQRDIIKGQEKLNFDEFGLYSERTKVSKWRNIVNRINDGTMPLKSYMLTHKKARLSKKDKIALLAWIENTM